jgi:hypothetical protein
MQEKTSDDDVLGTSTDGDSPEIQSKQPRAPPKVGMKQKSQDFVAGNTDFST